MRMRSILAFVAFLLLMVACTVTPPPEEEHLGTTSEELIAQGGRCLQNSQCQTGHCVDTVCCNTACGFGARDDFSCSNIYGTVPGLVDGVCTHLTTGQKCGSLTSFNPCKWRGSDINGGGNCPAPGDGIEFACQACNTSSDCPQGLPVCINHGCTSCVGDFGSGNPLACPTQANPACVDGACLECSASNSTACALIPNKGSCDIDLNKCVGCSGDFGSPPGPANKFPCTAAKPSCLPSGVCVDCSTDAQCNKDPTKTKCDVPNHVCVNCLDSTTCPGATPVCTNKQCVKCNGNHNSGATSACPTTTDPACVPSPTGPGTCEQCSASDSTACALVPGKPVCDTTNSLCVQCNVNNDCNGTPLTPFCSNHVCTAMCAGNGDCGGSTPICKGGVCVGCVDDAGCAATPLTPFCDTSVNQCVECRTSANCANPLKPVCNSVGTCVPCDGDNGSASPNACPTTTLPACNVATGACVQCNSGNSIRCTGGTPVCNLTTNTCVQCLNSGNCVETSSTPVCDTSNNTCTGCNADNGTAGVPPVVLACPGQLLPACVSGSCFECKDNAVNGTNLSACTPGQPVCKDSVHDCVECTSNAQCVGSNGICNLSNNTCGPGCSTDANCSSPTPRCKTAVQLCVECLDFTDCTGVKTQCDTTTNKCVECVSDAQCSGTKPFCEAGSCVPCNGDLGSGATHACKTSALPVCSPAGNCVQCSPTNNNCVAPTSACDPFTGTCVECTSNAQCSGSKPICDQTVGKCVPCGGDLGSGKPNSCFTAANGACATSGIHQGQCVECRTTYLNACTSAKPVCDPVNDVCVACNGDADCTGAAKKCDPTTHTCTTGCTDNTQCSGTTPVCNNGLCVECTATDTTHCVAPKDKCDTSTSTCVECTKSSECPNDKPVCNSVTHVCGTDCTKSSECPNTAPICNPGTGKCVQCTDDANCTSPTPRCDLTTGTCVPGNDAGAPDAGPTDAGTDAGSTDAGSDAGDGGGLDAGGTSGGVDSGTSGNVDSGVVVAGPCQTDSECPSGDICSPVTKTCVKDPFSVEGGGCGCRTESSRGSDAGGLVAFGLLGALVWRRRRNREGAAR